MTDEEVDALWPVVLPAGWRYWGGLVPGKYVNTRAWLTGDGLKVIASVEEWGGRLWLHASTSRENRLPSWEELKMVKDFVMGRETLALQVLPPASKYVNLHPFCLHLWRALEGPDPVPDFTRGSGQV